MTSAHGSSPSRRLAFSGTWYSGDPELLAGEVDGLLASASEPAVPGARRRGAARGPPLFRATSPRAAYRALGAEARDLIVLVGPSHLSVSTAVAILTRGVLETPWDPLPIAEDAADADCTGADHRARPAAEIHAGSTPWRLQLPFLARVPAGVPMVPMLIGQQTRETAIALGAAIAEALGSVNLALVASSDLSHYHACGDGVCHGPPLCWAALDAGSTPTPCIDALDRDPHHACGGGPMVAVMSAARRLGATAGGVLRYADSGDVTGDKSSVVGYASAAFSRPR